MILLAFLWLMLRLSGGQDVSLFVAFFCVVEIWLEAGYLARLLTRFL